MDLIKRYERLVTNGKLVRDLSQEFAISQLNVFRNEFVNSDPAGGYKDVLSRIFTVSRAKKIETGENGFYMFGGVGTGKSMMMDLFFESVLTSKKRRVHFHAFMYEFHENMKKVRLTKKRNPVRIVCQQMLSSIELLCFDEFQIIDITDAMIVGSLFQELFSGGMKVVTTSNFHPDELYKDGLNRKLFLPFILLLKENLKILEVDNHIDYRNRKLRKGDSYFCEKKSNALVEFNEIWEEILVHGTQELVLPYQGRELKLQNYVNGACRISFQELCEKPLSAVDYLNLCKHIKVLFLEKIPIISSAQNDIARRFIILIDTVYESKVRLVCLSAVEPEGIYLGGRFKKEFSRTVSRLNEMRGDDWQRGNID